MIRAIHYTDLGSFLRYGRAGSFHLKRIGQLDEWVMLFACPCGCGARHRIVVGNGFKPDHAPSWDWNGSRTEPTLSPSVNNEGHWHGWLRDGYWEAC